MNIPSILEIDNTKRDCFTVCPRKYYWEFVKNLRPKQGSTALRFGSALHSMLECHYKGGNLSEVTEAMHLSWEKESCDFTFLQDYRTKENLLFLFKEYLEKYKDEGNYLLVKAVEPYFKVPVPFPGLEVFFTGRMDLLLTVNEQKWIMDHKTTSMPVKTVTKSLHRSAQTIGYTWAALQMGHEIEGFFVNILKISSYFSTKKQCYTSVSTDFARIPLTYTESDFTNWLDSFSYTVSLILQAYSDDHWPLQFDGCYKWGTCPFTSLCEQVTTEKEEIDTSSFVTFIWDPKN